MEGDAENNVVGDEEERWFSCRTESSKIVSSVLQNLSLGNTKKDTICCIEVRPDMMVFNVTKKSKLSAARANLSSSIFDEYKFQSSDESSIFLSVYLNTVVDCLNLFGSVSENTTLSMSYDSVDTDFKLSLEESGVLTTCDISTLEVSEEYDGGFQGGLFSAFKSSQEEAQIVIKSEVLREGIQELVEIVGSEKVTVSVNNEEKSGLSLTAEGNMSVCEIELPASSNAFVSFLCTNRCTWDYALTSFHLGMKALSVASETYIRVNSDGMMCIQHLLETDMGEDTTIDFILVSSEEIEGITRTNLNQSSSLGHEEITSSVQSNVRSEGLSGPPKKFMIEEEEEEDAGYDDYTR